MKLRSRSIALTVLSILAVLVAFQNCGQPGAVVTQDKDMFSVKGEPMSDGTMLIVPANAENTDSDDMEVNSRHCHGLKIADLLLAPKSLELPGNKSAFEIADANPGLSLNKLSLKVKALQNAKVRHLFLKLDDNGNHLLSESGETLDLKTPSAQTSGLKIHLDSEVTVEAQKSYSLNLVIDLSQQVVMNPVKCLFKPVLKDASLTLLTE